MAAFVRLWRQAMARKNSIARLAAENWWEWWVSSTYVMYTIVTNLVPGAFASSTYVDRIVNIEQGDSKAPCRLNTEDSNLLNYF